MGDDRQGQSWDELKEFEHCPPSRMAFRAMVALLDTWSAGDQAAAIEYADKLLSTWPDEVRLAPWSWCKAASRGVVLPTWRLVRALELNSRHLPKGPVDLARLAHYAGLDHITHLPLPSYSKFEEISFLHHRPEAFPALKSLRAVDKPNDGDVGALAGSRLWRTLESLEIERLDDSLVHRKDASRIVPRFGRTSPIRHLSLRAADLIELWNVCDLPHLLSASVFIRSVREAAALAARDELARLRSLSIAFRGGFNGRSPWDPSVGNAIEADEAAAEAFFSHAGLDQLEKLSIFGYSMGYWGREGLGPPGLEALIRSGLLHRINRLRLQFLPLGDEGVAALAPALGEQLQTLELVNVYCKGDGAAALSQSPCISSLRHLDLSGNRIDPENHARMADTRMPHLRTLNLSGPEINPYYWNVGQQPLLDAGAAAWARSSNCRHLDRLLLRNCFLSDEGLAAIFESPGLRELERLDLSDNAFSAAAIAQAVVGSPIWENLVELGLSNCHLDNTAIEALAQVSRAPALRSLDLAYNSIGPKGAAALANWPVMARVWNLNLHDNVIGDDGLIALARSPCLGRLLELDLEQDCWNSRTFQYQDATAAALADSNGLGRLDGLFSGVVDEYHGATYSPGFSKAALEAIRKSSRMRPAFKASCSDFSGLSEYFTYGQFYEEGELGDHDFRRHPRMRKNKEAKPTDRGPRQVPYVPSDANDATSEPKAPDVRPALRELDLAETDIIEGIQFRDPRPLIDKRLTLELPLEDDQRPLPGQAGYVLSNTLRSAFQATALGDFDTSGSSSRQGKAGGAICTNHSFSVGTRGHQGPAVELIRDALWWIGAPARTSLKDALLFLNSEPASPASRFLQLAVGKVTRWTALGGGHRIDRVPFSQAQRDLIGRVLADFGVPESAGGWTVTALDDGGRARFHTKYLKDGPDYDTLNCFFDLITPQVGELVYRLMQEGAFMAWPMAFAASEDVAKAIDCDWPWVTLVASAAQLHEYLSRGPHHWWISAPNRRA